MPERHDEARAARGEPRDRRQVGVVVVVVRDGTKSIGGSDSSGTPGGTRRFGPANENGLARSENIGSVRNVTPSIRTSIVAWPIQVMPGLRWRPRGRSRRAGAAPGRRP